MVGHLLQGKQPKLQVTLYKLTQPLVEKSPLASYPPMGTGASFWWQDALSHTNQPRIQLTLEENKQYKVMIH